MYQKVKKITLFEFSPEDDKAILERFIEKCCFTDPDDSVSAIVLYGGYKEWCQQKSEYAVMTEHEFSRCMKDLGYDYNGINHYGIALAVAEPEELELVEELDADV